MRFILLLAILPLAAPAWSQDQFFPFAINQDALAGAPDFSFLNRPLGPADRIFIRNGQFYRVGPDLQPHTDDDERVRFFGVNLAFSANFPAPQDAERIARRLRRLGVNIVRLHHMDTSPDRDPTNAASLLTQEPYPALNQNSVARLRGFIDALKSEGIYINLNLHVGYQFRPEVDGVPALPDRSALPTQSKPLHIFHPEMVRKQEEFTRKVITELALGDDPAMAMAEINNESSLVYSWQTGALDRDATGEYRDELQQQWNGYLAAAYTDTAGLRAAWGSSSGPGSQMLEYPWRIEVHAPAQASFETAGETVRALVTRGGAPVILKQTGFSVAAGTAYTAEVELRADLPAGATRNVYWDVKQDVSPWRTVTGRTVAVGADWRKFTMTLAPSFAMDGIGRFGLSIENVDAAVYVRNWTLREAGQRGLNVSESLEDRNVAPVAYDDTGSRRRIDDYLRFLVDRDASYLRAMYQSVRDTAGPLVPVAGTQMGFGGLLNIDSHRALDYDDNHFYVDHYNFPNVSWDGRDWRIRDTSAVGSGLAVFQNMAIARTANRPYTVSEYNQPWPNTHAAEIDVALAAFGAFHDWDGIMHFAYSHGRGWDDGVPNGFNLNGDWTKWVNAGQAAWLFRSGAVQTGIAPVVIPLSSADRLRFTRERRNNAINAFLNSALGYEPANAFVHPLVLVPDAADPLPDAARIRPRPPYVADTGEFTYDPDRRLFVIHAPKAAGVIGFTGQDKISAGAIDVQLAASARGFATIVVTPLDDRPIGASSRLLLTTPGFALRSQPGVTPPRPQRLIHYETQTDWWTIEKEPAYPNKPSGNLNGGTGPVWMERVESDVTLRTAARSVSVYPLDGAGARLDPLPVGAVERVDGGFRIHLPGDSPWYEITAVF